MDDSLAGEEKNPNGRAYFIPLGNRCASTFLNYKNKEDYMNNICAPPE